MEESNLKPIYTQHTKLLLSVPEAAECLGVCSKVVYNLIHSKEFPTVWIGRRALISRAGLAEWVRKQEQSYQEGRR